MPRQSLDEKFARLKELEEQGLHSDDSVREIRQFMAGTSSVLAAKAAKAAARLEIRGLGPELVSLFHRRMKNSVKNDPGCHAKIAVVEALSSLDIPDADVFIQGIRHIQMEPSFGPPVDTADRLRAACAFGLYRMGHRELIPEMVMLLMDREPAARRAAIKVLIDIGQESCEMLLRLKALQGDDEPEIMGDCLNGLIAISPARSLPFVDRFLSAKDPAVVEEAALALGNSRLPEACMRLQEFRERSPLLKSMLLLPIALTRCEQAFSLLLDVIRKEHAENAAAAVEALSIYAGNPERRQLIREAVLTRNDPAVNSAYEESIVREKSAGNKEKDEAL